MKDSTLSFTLIYWCGKTETHGFDCHFVGVMFKSVRVISRILALKEFSRIIAVTYNSLVFQK